MVTNYSSKMCRGHLSGGKTTWSLCGLMAILWLRPCLCFSKRACICLPVCAHLVTWRISACCGCCTNLLRDRWSTVIFYFPQLMLVQDKCSSDTHTAVVTVEPILSQTNISGQEKAQSSQIIMNQMVKTLSKPHLCRQCTHNYHG